MSLKDRKCRIVDVPNTYNSALNILRQKEYSLYLMPDKREDYYGCYWAIKEDRDFIAENPLSLLGLVTLWEHYGDDWRKEAKERNVDIKVELENISYPEDAYSNLSDLEFKNMLKYLKSFVEAQWVELPPDPTRDDIFKFFENINNE